MFLALVVAVVGSLGAPLITSVATTYHVSLTAAQWTLTITLVAGAVATPLLGRVGAGRHRRAATLGALTAVTLGSVCTIAPGPFALLLGGRAAQGVGLGLVPLLMATARDAFDQTRSATVIAMLSVASTAGVGVGYPLAGLLTDLGGVRAAYGAGLAVTATALLVGVLLLPRPRATPPPPDVDWPGCVLLSLTLVAVLVPLGDEELWQRHALAATSMLVAGGLMLLAWVQVERRVGTPLVDLRALRHPLVVRANLTMFVSGVAMYLLLTLATRYAQTPSAGGYGFGLDTFQAGLVLVPFSAAGFAAGRAVPRVVRRSGASVTVAVSALVVALGFLVFASGRATPAGPVLAVTVLGVGVGAVSAAMPAMILAVTPAGETASAMGVNQVVRSVGFSLGSALGGFILSARTLGNGLPAESGYLVASLVGVALSLTAAMLVVTPRITP